MHVAGLPGKPDFANKKRKWVIFVHGCFWHSHRACKLASRPKSNQSYWGPKLHRNKERDVSKIEELKRLDYRVLVVWECETRNDRIESRVRKFFANRLL
jgi:DNA mismatch endonuclease (patch repair protein)